MTTVNIKGSFAKEQRPDNGLDEIADYLDAHRLTRIPIVGLASWWKVIETVDGKVVVVAFDALEPALNAEGADPTGAGEQVRQILDQLRKLRGLGQVTDTLFDAAADPDDRPDVDDGPAPGGGRLPGADEPTIPGTEDDGPVSERRRDEWLGDPS